MITKDYLSEFNSPIRKISGKAELYTSSAGTAQGNPVAIEATGDIVVKLESKNLLNLEGREVVHFGNFDKSSKRQYQGGKGIILGYASNNYYGGASYTAENSTFSVGNDRISYILKQNAYGIAIDIKLKPNTIYTLSQAACSSWGVNLVEFDKEGNYLGIAQKTNGTITTKPETDWGVITIAAGDGEVFVDYPQLEYGATATPYTPYVEDFSAIPTENNLVATGFTDSDFGYCYSQEFYLENGKTYTFEITTVDGSMPVVIITPSGWMGNSSPAYAYGESGEFTHEYSTADNWVMYLDIAASNIASARLVEVGNEYTTTPATITASGKNLFNKEDWINYCNSGVGSLGVLNDTYLGEECFSYRNYGNSGRADFTEIDFKPNTRYTISGEMAFKFGNNESYSMPYLRVVYTDGSSYYEQPTMYSTKFTTNSWTTDANKSVSSIGLVGFGAGVYIYCKWIQIEEGITATEYEDYIEPVEYSVGENNSVVISAANAPTTVISTIDSAIINATYNSITLGNTFSSTDYLQSITIDREGENGKFFGFGIGQKATIKLVDRNREINVEKGNILKTYFNISDNDYINNFPDFIAETPTRNENNNELTIVANDKLTAAAAHTVEELGLVSYSIREFATACASLLGLGLEIKGVSNESCFDTQYENGANFSGTETLRQALNAVAEATQTIYFISGGNLVFKRLEQAAADLAITKDSYFTLENHNKYTIDSVGSITELGDNVSTPSNGGITQNVKDNPFWVLREDVAELVEDATAAINGLTINAFNCKWRGNFLVELGDKLEITTKDDNTITSYLLNDSITYQGGYIQTSRWEYSETEQVATNPTTIGEALRQTSAKVDKQAQQIDLVVSESAANNEAIAALQLTTNSINATVSGVRGEMDAANDELSILKSKVNAQITESDVVITVQNELDKGVNKVLTGKDYTLDDKGLTIADINPDTNNEIETTVSNNGMVVKANSEEKLKANDAGVVAVDLHAKTYLIIGENSRFEDYNGRTACFWIGGSK